MIAANVTFAGPRHYDEQLAPLTFAPFARELAARMPPDPGGPVLETACGTGVLTRRLRERLAPHVQLAATDLSPAMLEYARMLDGQLAGVTWREADMQQLPFEDGSFAGLACAFGLMFAPDRGRALAEAHRVLAPGGLLLLAVWDRIEENPHGLANAEVIEALFPGDAQMKFRTPYELHDEDLLHALLAQAGFGEVRIETVRLPIEGADPRALAEGQVRGTPRSALLVERGVALDEVIERIAALLRRRGGDPYRGSMQGKVVQARRT